MPAWITVGTGIAVVAIYLSIELAFLRDAFVRLHALRMRYANSPSISGNSIVTMDRSNLCRGPGPSCVRCVLGL